MPLISRSLIPQFLIRHLLPVVVCVVSVTAGALAGTAEPPNIILITVDTTRADRMGFMGSRRGLTPNLDVLARQSVVFTHAYSQAPFTAPSHATILTGTYPQFHQVEDFPVPLAKDLPYAPALLKAGGYQTAAFVGSIVLDPAQGLGIGLDRGFNTYDAGFHMSVPGEDHYSSTGRRGSVVVEHALAWLNTHQKSPFFIWVHLYDAHNPYDPPEPFLSRYKKAPYDGGVAYVDFVVGKLLSQLRARGLYENSVVAVMSDHGESLGDHGEDFHGFFLYDATIHVPLVLKLPQERFAGKRIEDRVGLVDVLPTILQAVGVAIPQQVQGESLLDLMNSKPPSAPKMGFVPASAPDRPMYAETEYGLRAYGWSVMRSLRTGKYLFVEAPRRELYDLAADPKAEHNLAATSKAVADTLQGQLDAFRQKTSKSGEAPSLPTDPQVQEKLAALGYMSASTQSPAAPSMSDGTDPKDKIEVGNMMTNANCLLEETRYDEAAVLLKQVIAKEPKMTIAYAKLGTAEVGLQNFPEAIKAKRKAVELLDSPDLHFELGKVLVMAQEYEAAIPELEAVEAQLPGSWKTQMLLAMAYSRTNRLPQSITESEKVLAVLPEQFGINLLLGRVQLRSGNAEAALSPLTKAASLRPQSPEPHMSLADAYAKLGRNEDAERERAVAKRLAESRPGPGEP